MNFKLGRFFYLLSSFIVGLFLLLIGLFTLILPWSRFLRDEFIHFLDEGSVILSLFGLGFLLIGISLLIYSFSSTKKRYISLKTGPQSVTVDENIIHHYLETYWEDQFPKHHIPSQLKIKKNSIHIIADLPFIPKEDQKEFLTKIKKDFDDIFKRLLGYPHDIHLIASFKNYG